MYINSTADLYGPTQLRTTLLLRAICIRDEESPQSQTRTGTADRSAETARPAANRTSWRRASLRPATAQLTPEKEFYFIQEWIQATLLQSRKTFFHSFFLGIHIILMWIRIHVVRKQIRIHVMRKQIRIQPKIDKIKCFSSKK